MELQSGFVLAVIIAAVLLVERLGGTNELARRLFQVALGAVLAFAVVSGTIAFIRPPDIESTQEALNSSDGVESYQALEDLNDRNSVRTSIHLGAGIVAFVLGIAWLRRMTTLPLACLFAGVLLILFGGLTAPTSNAGADSLTLLYGALLGITLQASSQSTAIAHFVVLLGGALVPLGLGYREWEEQVAERADDMEEAPA